MNDDRAHARRADPETSHQAADAITPHVETARNRVRRYAWACRQEGFTDAQMCADLDDEGSTLRTRRAELTARNIILDSNKRRPFRDSQRLRIVWVHRDFVANPPPILDDPAPPPQASQPKLNPQLKEKALAMAGQYDQFARSMRSEGRAYFADQLTEGAALLRALVQ